MGLRISGKNLDIGEAMRTHIQDKIAAAVARYFDGGLQGHVVIEREGSGFRCDCAMHLNSGITIAADGKGQEPYATFDAALERIEKRLRRYKSRLKDHHGTPIDAALPELMAEKIYESPHEDEDGEGFAPVIVAENHVRLKILTVANAVLELDVTGASVVVFRHAGNAEINLVYRRRDGHIGWIDPMAGASAKTPLDKIHKAP